MPTLAASSDHRSGWLKQRNDTIKVNGPVGIRKDLRRCQRCS